MNITLCDWFCTQQLCQTPTFPACVHENARVYVCMRVHVLVQYIQLYTCDTHFCGSESQVFTRACRIEWPAPISIQCVMIDAVCCMMKYNTDLLTPRLRNNAISLPEMIQTIPDCSSSQSQYPDDTMTLSRTYIYNGATPSQKYYYAQWAVPPNMASIIYPS